MKQLTTLATTLAMAMALSASAQLITRPDPFWASGVNNGGLVAGYMATGSTYQLWNPDLGTTEDIGGISPADGAGGQAKFSADGQLVSGGSAGTTGSEMATYDRNAEMWTVHGGLGSVMDGNVSSAWGISGDGATVVGLAWVPGGNAHGAAWNATEGLMDLGSLFSDASTRANAVSGDGSIVVGWQDLNGPWKSAVWRKDPAGGYFPNTYLLIDEGGSASDENNQVGECSAISADGTWIGGYGDFANNDEPWIWSEATGLINLGTLPDMGPGFVSSINSDGSVVVGWFNGQFFGSPRKAFIWTEADGLQDLNAYATTTMGISLGTKQLYTASDISPNGRYITGTGKDDSDFSMFAYRLDLDYTTGIAGLSAVEDLNVYPNPATDMIQFRSPTTAEMIIASVDGSVVQRSLVQGDVSMDLSDLAAGVYTIVLRSEGAVRTQRIMKH